MNSTYTGSGRSGQVPPAVKPGLLQTAVAALPHVCQQHLQSGQAVLQRPATTTGHPETAGGGRQGPGGPGHGLKTLPYVIDVAAVYGTSLCRHKLIPCVSIIMSSQRKGDSGLKCILG